MRIIVAHPAWTARPVCAGTTLAIATTLRIAWAKTRLTPLPLSAICGHVTHAAKRWAKSTFLTSTLWPIIPLSWTKTASTLAGSAITLTRRLFIVIETAIRAIITATIIVLIAIIVAATHTLMVGPHAAGTVKTRSGGTHTAVARFFRTVTLTVAFGTINAVFFSLLFAHSLNVFTASRLMNKLTNIYLCVCNRSVKFPYKSWG